MTRGEILKLIGETRRFTDISRDDLLNMYREIGRTGSPIMIGLCLHTAFLVGYETAMNDIAQKTVAGIEWSQALRQLALPLEDQDATTQEAT